MWLQNTCHAFVIPHNLIERKSCDKVDSGDTQPGRNESILCLHDLGTISLERALFDFSALVGEVGFVFSNSIVHYTVKEPELPVACSNKPELGLHPRPDGLQMGRRGESCGLAVRLKPQATRSCET